MGRLGCNSRSCHGSFQGRGGFRLSLFGYDFKADHDALLDKKAGRVDLETPELSKVLQKPTMGIPHKGGKRMEPEGWAYRLLVRWIEDGAKGVNNPPKFDRLEVIPEEVVFDEAGKTTPLQVIAHWADGTSEDVTCLSRFRTNDEAVAEVNEDGVITSKGKGDTHVVAFYDNGVAVTQVLAPLSDKVGSQYPDVPAPTKIDALVVAKLKKLGIVPSEVCTDAEFLRRVSIDLTGTLPGSREIEAFLAETSPNKREAKVDELLGRKTYSAYWANKLCEITGDSPRLFQGQLLNEEQARQWYEWVEKRVRENMPYDQLVAGIVLATSRKPGQSYDDYIKERATYFRPDKPADFSECETMPYYWARRIVNTPEEKALSFSHTFLGVRMECAQCHKHPFDQWTQDDFKQFTAFFTPVRYAIGPDGRQKALAMRKDLGIDKLPGGQAQRELARLAREGTVVPWQEVLIVRAAANGPGPAAKAQAKGNAAAGRVITPKLLGGEVVPRSAKEDPRKPLMDWMRSKDNPYFARALINRVWANDFGRGIVNPPDDMNLANPPGNAALLDYLAEGFIAHDFDMKWLHREITLSQTYQRSWKANETNTLDEKNFSRAIVRRLPAEVVIDAIAQVTAGPVELAVWMDKPGLEERAIGPKGGAGLPRRNGGGEFAFRVFGRSTREVNCDCSTSNEPNLLQSIFLQNDGSLYAQIDRPGGWVDQRSGNTARLANRDRADTVKTIAKLEKEIADLDEKTRVHEDDPTVTDSHLALAKLRERLADRRNRLAKVPKSGPARPDRRRAGHPRRVSASPGTSPDRCRSRPLERAFFAGRDEGEGHARPALGVAQYQGIHHQPLRESAAEHVSQRTGFRTDRGRSLARHQSRQSRRPGGDRSLRGSPDGRGSRKAPTEAQAPRRPEGAPRRGGFLDRDLGRLRRARGLRIVRADDRFPGSEQGFSFTRSDS